jgi:hypothetical protein
MRRRLGRLALLALALVEINRFDAAKIAGPARAYR